MVPVVDDNDFGSWYQTSLRLFKRVKSIETPSFAPPEGHMQLLPFWGAFDYLQLHY